MNPIVVIAEHQNGFIRPVTDDLVGFALRLQQIHSGDIRIVVLDADPETLAKTLARKTGMAVTAVCVPGLVHYHGEVYKNVLAGLLSKWQPSHVCTAHTAQGLDFAPGLAVRLGAAGVTGVEGVTACGGRIVYTRAMCGGKIMADVVSDTACTVLSVMPGAFTSHQAGGISAGPVEPVVMEAGPVHSRTSGTVRPDRKPSTIDAAKVIVAVGQGIQDRENLELIHRLAGLFPESAVAGSRIVCDLGWLDYDRQVGVTGRTVSPDIYIACGISGAVQHVAGMKGSGFVVAINSDSNSAMFNVSDVCVVENMITFLPLLIEEYEKQLSGET